MNPTAEQIAAVEAFGTDGSVVVSALAGTGKTHTLALMADSTNRRGQYLAFNRALIGDASAKLPDRCQANTVHSLAFRAVGKSYRSRLDASRRMSSMDIARVLRLEGIELPTGVGNERRKVSAGFLAGLVMRGVDRFCQSADEVPAGDHVPYVDGLDMPQPDGRKGWANNREMRRNLAPFLTRAWLDLCQTRGQLRFSHSCYLKMWELSGPVVDADYLLWDEVQDSSKVMESIVLQQKQTQVCAVGDAQQAIYCQPAGTLVDVPAGPLVAAPGYECAFDGCTRTRNHKATGLCHTHELQSRLGGPLVSIARAPRAVDVIQLPIEELAEGDNVVTYDNSHVFKRGRPIVGVRRKPYNGRLIRLSTEDGSSSAYTPEHHCIIRIGPELRDKHMVYLMRRGDQFRIGRVPMQYASQGGGFGLKMRAVAERADAAWMLSVHDTVGEALLAEALTQHRFNIPGLRFRPMASDVMDIDAFWAKHGTNVREGSACLEHFGRLLDFPLWQSGTDRVGSRLPFTTAAANLVSGMRVLVRGAEVQFKGKADYVAPARCWVPAQVSHEWYVGDVVSIEVADHHTYYGDGILTHNSWMGAIDALTAYAERADHNVTLTQSWRSGPAIAEAANALLAMLGTDLRLRGHPDIDSTIADEPLAAPAAILCRTNAVSVRQVIAQRAKGRRVALVGDGSDVLRFARAAQELQQRGSTSHPDLACFMDWAAVRQYVIADALGGELRLLVQLVDEFGVPTIESALSGLWKEDQAEVVVSTAHKGKGRQWSTVALADDFPTATPEKPLDPEELRLQYVAVTRAQHVLDLTACPTLAAIVAGEEPNRA